MATTDLEKLVVQLSADLKSYENGLAKAQRTTVSQLRRMERDMDASAGRMARTWGALGTNIKAGLAGAFAAFASVQTLRALEQMVSSVAEIADNAERVGITAEQMQALSFAGRQTATDTDKIVDALQKMNVEIGQAMTQGNNLGRIFEANGIALRDGNGQARQSIEYFFEIVDLIKNAANDQDRMVILQEAFGKGAADALPFLMQGAEEIKRAMEIAQDSGAVIDENLVKKAKEFDDAWTATMDTWSATLKAKVLEAGSELQRLWNTLVNPPENMMQAMALLRSGSPDATGGVPQTSNTAGKGSLPGKPTILPQFTTSGSGSAAAEARRAAAEAARAAHERERLEIQALDSAYELLMEQQSQLHDSYLTLAEAGYSAFQRIVMGGEKATDVIKDLVKQLVDAAMAALLFGQGPLAGLFNQSSGNALYGTAPSGGLFGQLFGRAGGGHVNAGRPYMVGEHRPEIFVPKQSGSIMPGTMRGGGNVTIIDQRSNAPAVETRRQPNGDITTIIRDSVKRSVADGGLDGVFGARFGVAPRGTRR